LIEKLNEYDFSGAWLCRIGIFRNCCREGFKGKNAGDKLKSFSIERTILSPSSNFAIVRCKDFQKQIFSKNLIPEGASHHRFPHKHPLIIVTKRISQKQVWHKQQYTRQPA